MNIAQLIEGFFLVRSARLAKTTQDNYRICASQLMAFLGAETRVSDITPDDLRRFMEHLRLRKLTDRSIADKLTIVSSFLTFAESNFGITNAARAVVRPGWTKRKISPLRESEIKALVQAAEWSQPWTGRKGKPTRSKQEMWLRNVAMILVLLDTGMRASELCALEMRDYERTEQRLDIRHGKGNKQRFAYLGQTAARALWRYRITREQTPAAPLFATKYGKPVNRTQLAKTLGRIATNAGVPHVHPHRFRHTFAVNFLRNGGNVYELKELLGHETLQTVMEYLEFTLTDLAAAHRKASPADRWNL